MLCREVECVGLLGVEEVPREELGFASLGLIVHELMIIGVKVRDHDR